MVKNKKNSAFLILTASSLVVTLILTPWVNVDSLVIPKLVVLFSTAMYLLPFIFINFKSFLSQRPLKFLFALSGLMILQMILVMIFSSAPIEQQVFGKTGRGLGFLTEISLLIMMLAAASYAEINKIHFLINGMVLSAVITSVYSIFQKNGLDFVDWYTKTNGIIGTLGNPNFQAAFAAIAIVPSLSYFFLKSIKSKIFSVFIFSILIYVIYLSQSTQGYLIAVLSVVVSILIYLWYKNKSFFVISAIFAFIAGMVTILGILNNGPLASILYKYSIKSRGEFFRTAISATKDNPVFGVGLDSFGDFSTSYKSAKDAAGVNEYFDNAHNYFLNYAANGGISLALLYVAITVLALISFFKLQKQVGEFNIKLSALFSAWVGFQAQSVISPGAIPIILNGMILNGALIGLSVRGLISDQKLALNYNLFRPFSYFLVIISLLITYPYYNVDRLQLKSLNTNDGLLAIKAATSYPESSLRYARIGTKLLESNLGKEGLEVGRAAIKFNPNSISAWGLILANSTAPLQERQFALKEILRLDPYNQKIREIESVLK